LKRYFKGSTILKILQDARWRQVVNAAKVETIFNRSSWPYLRHCFRILEVRKPLAAYLLRNRLKVDLVECYFWRNIVGRFIIQIAIASDHQLWSKNLSDFGGNFELNIDDLSNPENCAAARNAEQISFHGFPIK